MASEEEADYIPVPQGYPVGRYVILFDPCDGSSNIDVNVAIGTIFSVLRKVSREERGCLRDCLQAGVNQVAAGYVVYGSSTMLVMTTGQGVHGFTLDPSVGEYFLSHPHINTPLRGHIYSANEGNSHRWNDGVKNYLNYLKTPKPEENRPYTARYVGSLVSDFHRNLLKGGIFLYPADSKNKNGKLRLLYEANPMSMVIEQAGGAASNGTKRILEIEPEELHQRTPLIIGSAEDVSEADEFIQGKRTE
jgi:fructose-1,6-bisphosphatase I